jgi:putative transposase
LAAFDLKPERSIPMRRLPASAETRKQLEELFAGRREGDPGGGKSDLVKLAARLIIEEALEAEAGEALGRGYYERAEANDGAFGAYRNGSRRGSLESSEGRIEYAVPQLRGIAGWRSEVRQALAGRTEELERLAIEMYARGLSVRDIEAAFSDPAGHSVMSKSAASRVAERLWEDYQHFATRSLAETEVVYLFVDGVAERLHLGQPREAVLCAWGIDASGAKHLLGLLPGTKEDTASCRDFLRDLKARGLADPILVASDGAAGLIRAVEDVFPRSLRQRCLAHKMRHLQAKVPEERWREVIPAARAAYQAPSQALARLAAEEFRKSWARELPAALSCFDEDFEACIAHLKLPIAHRRVTRTTNLLERLFGEERRRTKVIPHAFGERAVMKLMFAALIRASQTWRGIPINEFERRQLDQLRTELDQQFDERHAVPLTPQSRSRISSNQGT